jgi:hypothetical protein
MVPIRRCGVGVDPRPHNVIPEPPQRTPTSSGRYRYYVSHAILQKRYEESGNVTGVPAHEIEALLIGAVRGHVGGVSPCSMTDRD